MNGFAACLAGVAGWLTFLSVAAGQVFSTNGWRLAVPDDPAWHWNFHRIYAPQPAFQTEWWYCTGHLTSAIKDRFGFQLTFFRIGFKPPSKVPAPPEGAPVSAWRFQSIWMAHFAITDETRRRYVFFNRVVRGAMDLAGYREQTNGVQKLHVGNWWMAQMPKEKSGPEKAEAQSGGLIQALSAQRGGWALDLKLDPGAAVLEGDHGLSQKAAGKGRASYYYSYPMMMATGTVERPDRAASAVRGRAWFDREIGSNQLGPDQKGWDWFAIQLANGDALMLYRLRLKNGGQDPYSQGKWIPRMPASRKAFVDGVTLNTAARTLPVHAFWVEPLGWWTSPRTGARYPIRWRVQVPSLHLRLNLAATVPDQEFVATNGVRLAYWEGSESVAGSRAGRPVRGKAYVELTGYAGAIAVMR